MLRTGDHDFSLDTTVKLPYNFRENYNLPPEDASYVLVKSTVDLTDKA